MKKINPYIILTLILIFTGKCLAQKNCEVPESPKLNLVSVNHGTGIVTLNWDLSPSQGIAAYVIYTYNEGVGIPVDTIWDPLATSYQHITPASGYFSVSYVVAAHRMPDCTSPLSNNLNTIFAKAEIDTCLKEIKVSWNRYLSYPNEVKWYSISTSVNGEAFSEIAQVNKDTLNFKLKDFLIGSDYSFFIEANLEGGLISESNKTARLSTIMQRPPDWINADFASISENKVSVSFSIDPISEISNYLLERKTDPSGSFTEIARPVSATGNVKYTDDKADPKVINFYRLSAINSCKNPLVTSNLASNIVLRIEKLNNDIILKWNHYKYWNGILNSYIIQANTGNGYSQILSLSPSDSSVAVNYRDLMYDITTGELCFKVSANEVSNPHGISGYSLSQEECTDVVEIITVPDVFTPNNDRINDLFRRILSFTPSDYTLVVRDRQGRTVFESKNYSESRDGTTNGKKVSQGVYLWYLSVKTPSGKTINRTGTLTVFFNR